MRASSPPAGRSGRYIRQPSGYRAFIPTPLPPVPEIAFDSELRDALSQADRALGRLDGAITTLPDPDLFIAMYVRREAVLSSQIEGTQSSLQDVLSAEARLEDANRPADVAEVFNYIAAMNHGLARLPDLPVSSRLLREIHGELLAGARGAHLTPGEFRRSQNWIGPAGCGLNDAAFVPPPPDQVQGHMADLERFLHSTSELPLLIKIGLAHAQLETIHPFLDGNGRLGRLLITFLLKERNVLMHPILYLSVWFKQHRARYYTLLQATRDEGAWEPWLLFFLRGVREVSEAATTTTRDILRLRSRDQERIASEVGAAAGAAFRLHAALFRRPNTSIREAEAVTGLSYASARGLVHRLADLGLLDPATSQKRNQRWNYTRYIALFTPDTAPLPR